MSHRLPVLLMSLSALGACASTRSAPDPRPMTSSAADAHRIEVEQTAERLEIGVPGAEAALTQKARDDIDAFAGGYLRYGHGALVLSAPAGENEPAAQRIAQETRAALAEAGVSYAAIAASTYDAAGRADAPVILSFARFEAVAPECAPLWSQDIGHQNDNRPWESFGCATQANLAALVEDPQDLLHPRAEDPRDGERRSVMIENYRQGRHTHAERTNDERVNVSHTN